jgi:hypothetical protein
MGTDIRYVPASPGVTRVVELFTARPLPLEYEEQLELPFMAAPPVNPPEPQKVVELFEARPLSLEYDDT